MTTIQSIEQTSPTPGPTGSARSMPSERALTEGRQAHPARPRDSFRPELQGLRAVAVGLVVLFHLWPMRLRGGYVGVDVFFVISGYLITSHIFREVATTGRLRVTRFWARRIRRLLPASLLVLVLSAVGVVAWAPTTMWQQSFRQIAASALYVQNWALAQDSVDYMAKDNVPTVAQHYWSLSVEEQFYAVWPVLIVALLAAHRWLVARSSRPGAPTVAQQRGVVLTALVLLFGGSLVWSAVSTAQDQAFAYMSSFTRTWEFAAGAITGLLSVTLPRRTAAVAGWLGLGAIVLAGFAYTESSLFPGYLALLPVLGTVTVIMAARGGVGSAGWWLSLRPARFVGDVSYSVYLIHWPLIVLLPLVTGHAPRWREKLGIVAVTLVLAWLSKTFVEDPLRVRPFLAAAPWRAFAFAAVGALVLVGANVDFQKHLEHRQQVVAAHAAATLESGKSCVGPDALVAAHQCGPVSGDGTPTVPADLVARESNLDIFRSCQQALELAALKTCHLGTQDHPRRTVALVGDSHAGALVPLMDALGKALHWDVIASTKGSCPASMARRVLPNETAHDRQASCESFNAQVNRQILANPAITDVFVTSFTSAYQWQNAPGGTLRRPGVEGFQTAWKQWVAAGKRVHVIRDVPATDHKAIPDCIARTKAELGRCDTARSAALPPDLAVTAALAMHNPKVTVIDLTPQFCTDATCYGQIGNVIVYRDRSHLSVEYSRLLAPAVIAQLGRVVEGN